MFHKYKRMIRPFDVIIVILLVLFSFAPNAVFALRYGNMDPNNKNVAVITIDGTEVDRFVLAKDTPHQLIEYTREHGLTGNQYNIIEVDGTRIRVKEDNSPDQIAVRTGWIERPGQTSISLPHRLIIRIKSLSPTPDEETIIISS